MPQRARRNCHFKATNPRKMRRMEPKEFPASRRAVVRIWNFKACAVDSGAWQKAEIAKWWPTIKAANAKVDQPRTRSADERLVHRSSTSEGGSDIRDLSRISRRLSSLCERNCARRWACIRDPVAHPGYGIPVRVKRTRQSKPGADSETVRTELQAARAGRPPLATD
jgi:hypothetical protein